MVRPGVGVLVGQRGGFFKKLFKGVKKAVSVVAKVPILGTIAKTAISSLPVVGQVVTAVGAIKKTTAAGIAASVFGAAKGLAPGGGAAVNFNKQAAAREGRRAAKRAPKKRAPKKRAAAKRSGGSAKQRAARARFARAARKGRIKKGARL